MGLEVGRSLPVSWRKDDPGRDKAGESGASEHHVWRASMFSLAREALWGTLKNRPVLGEMVTGQENPLGRGCSPMVW